MDTQGNDQNNINSQEQNQGNAVPQPNQAPNQVPSPGQTPQPNQAPNQNNQNQNIQTSGHNYNLIAASAYFLFFIPLFFGDKKDNPFVKFHTKQGFGLFMLYIINVVLGYAPVPFIGMISWIISVFAFVLFILGIINAVSNKQKELPIIGQYVRNVDFL